MNLLARPALGARDRAALQALVEHPRWRPLLLPGLHREVLPLVRANAEDAGIPFHRLFASADGEAVPPPAACVIAAYAREQRLAELAGAFLRHDIRRAVLIKGAGIARHMASPALRMMCDLDLLLPEEDLAKARAACEDAGWSSCSRRASVFRHPSGWTVDLQVPATPLGEALLASARPQATAPWHLPRPELHAALIAIHCFQGHGERVWRDVADYRCLAESEPWGEEAAAGALRLAVASGEGEALEAFRILAAHLDGAAPTAATPPSRAVRQRVELLALMAAERTPEVTLHLVRRLQRPMGEWLAPLRPAPAVEPSAGEAVRGLYDLPRRERIGRACRLLAGGVFSPRTRRLFRACALQRKVSSRSLFDSPAGRCAHAAGTAP